MSEGVVVLAMAGRSMRFTEVGVTLPKWALRAGGQTLLWWAVHSLSSMLEAGWSLHLVALSDHVESTDFRIARRELPVAASVTAVPETPPGQALSVLAAGQQIDRDAPLAIWNVDTLLLPGPEPVHSGSGDWMTLAPLAGAHWSFAEVGRRGNVRRTAEKERISRWASVGLYGFESHRVFEELLLSAPSQGAETYVAPLYNSAVEHRRSVLALRIPAERVVPFGTPSEMIKSCSDHGLSLPAELSRSAPALVHGGGSVSCQGRRRLGREERH